MRYRVANVIIHTPHSEIPCLFYTTFAAFETTINMLMTMRKLHNLDDATPLDVLAMTGQANELAHTFVQGNA